MHEKKRVVVFDDDEDLLQIFTFLFEEDGWEVYTYQNCDDVVEIALKLSPQLILMDNWIPNLGGVAATQLLKKNDKLSKIPVIYISANNDIEKLAHAAGADGFIAKPFYFEPLLELANTLSNKS